VSARVVCIGIATLDAIALVPRLPVGGERLPAVEARLAGGGVAATAAVALARLGTAVAFVGRVGDDDAGRFLRAGIEAEGVDVTGLATVPGRTPTTLVLVEDMTGERTLVPDVRGVPAIDLTEDDLGACAAADWIHVDQTGYPALAAVRAAGIATPVSLDGGNMIDTLDLADVQLYAPTERALLERYPGASLERALAAALAEGPAIVVATRGAEGSIAAQRNADGSTRLTTAPALETTVLSTLGAGDVFHGALLAALVEGHDLPTALRRANGAAALACRALDGRSAIPTRTELDDALANATRNPEVTHAG
jgi:sugar/nucleoside kinase (ribokinase family)